MNNTEKMKEYFDRLAPSWAPDEKESGIRNDIIRLAGFEPGRVIADIGSGRSVMAPHLLKTNPKRIIEIDISSEMIRLAKEAWNDDRIEFLCGDFLRAELPELDAALIFNALPHFIDRKALAEKLASCLKPNGIVIIAHSKGRETINGIHKGGGSETLSAKLLEPLAEYENFKPHFRLDRQIDCPEMYFLKMEKT